MTHFLNNNFNFLPPSNSMRINGRFGGCCASSNGVRGGAPHYTSLIYGTSLHYATIDSTNDEAKRLLAAGALLETTLITADSQTAGRGTQGRVWVSSPGQGLCFTIATPYDCPLPECVSDFTRAAGVGCAVALEAVCGLKIGLKPVNDLYVQGKKLGGILCESIVQGERLKALITGVGINMLPLTQALPDERCEAISLQETMLKNTFQQLDKDVLLEGLVTEILAYQAKVWDGDIKRLEILYHRCCL